MKDKVTLQAVYQLITQYGFTITVEEPDRVYGASVMLSEGDIDVFAKLYFPNLQLPPPEERQKMSPKYLLVDAHERVSWQYHERRREHWSVITGPVGVSLSKSDEEGKPQVLEAGEGVQIAQGMRHRLVGLDTTGVIAEIWTHTDSTHPSAESDIVRLQDDYARPVTG